MTKFQELSEFVTRAEKNRKYPPGTAQSLRAALKLFESELNPDEQASVETVKKNFAQITQSVFKKNANHITASSLASYKSRVLKAIADFDRYNDPVKMNSWVPKVIARTIRPKTKKPTGASSSTDEDPTQEQEGSDDMGGGTEMHRIELSLRPDVKALIKVPHDLTEKEATRVKALIDSLVAG